MPIPTLGKLHLACLKQLEDVTGGAYAGSTSYLMDGDHVYAEYTPGTTPANAVLLRWFHYGNGVDDV